MTATYVVLVSSQLCLVARVTVKLVSWSEISFFASFRSQVLRSMSHRSGRFCLTIIWHREALVGRAGLEGQNLNIHPFWELALDAWPKSEVELGSTETKDPEKTGWNLRNFGTVCFFANQPLQSPICWFRLWFWVKTSQHFPQLCLKTDGVIVPRFNSYTVSHSFWTTVGT